MRYDSKPIFVRTKRKKLHSKNFTIVWKISEFSINFLSTVSDSYFNQGLTVLVPHFSQVCLPKYDTILWLLNLRSNWPFLSPVPLWIEPIKL